MAADRGLEEDAATYCCVLGCSSNAGSTPVNDAWAMRSSRMPSGRGADQMYRRLRSCVSAMDSLHHAEAILHHGTIAQPRKSVYAMSSEGASTQVRLNQADGEGSNVVSTTASCQHTDCISNKWLPDSQRCMLFV